MASVIECPRCGGALELPQGDDRVKCRYCGSLIVVPEAATPRPPAPQPSTRPDPRLPDSTLADVAALLGAGRRVRATIRYRQITGATLRQARLAIDRFLAGGSLERPPLG